MDTGQEVLDRAQENGLFVTMGLEIAREREGQGRGVFGFDYDDEEAVAEQSERVRAEVMELKDHPALIIWGIGNELNLGATNPKVWDAVNEISEMIHEVDPNHLTTTMLAGIGPELVEEIKARAPDLDLVSIQMYADIENLQQRIDDAGWDGPYVVTEWGATGHWETGTTAWGAPIENNSSVKADLYRSRYETAIASDTTQGLGSYVFLWGQKQERTPTWYGMFIPTGEKTESVDVMQYALDRRMAGEPVAPPRIGHARRPDGVRRHHAGPRANRPGRGRFQRPRRRRAPLRLGGPPRGNGPERGRRRRVRARAASPARSTRPRRPRSPSPRPTNPARTACSCTSTTARGTPPTPTSRSMSPSNSPRSAETPIFVGPARLHPNVRPVEGGFAEVDGLAMYRIAHYDRMSPFFVTLVSDADHWLFISSNGALSAGRKSPEHALFPYYTVDKIHDSQDLTGSKTLILATRQGQQKETGNGTSDEGEQSLWEPFSDRYAGIYVIRRTLFKSLMGDTLRFEEVNEDLGLTFSVTWSTSERFGFVKRSELVNHGTGAATVRVLDGVQNLMPYGISRELQTTRSVLADAYKKNELVPDTTLGLFTLSAIPVDKAEPSEALKATTVWSAGLDPQAILLSTRQLDRFRAGHAVETETAVRAERGAYFGRRRPRPRRWSVPTLGPSRRHRAGRR